MTFFRAELRTGLNLSRIALRAAREDKIRRNRADARKAYDWAKSFDHPEVQLLFDGDDGAPLDLASHSRIHIAPDPGLTRFDGTYQRVASAVKVSGGMLV